MESIVGLIGQLSPTGILVVLIVYMGFNYRNGKNGNSHKCADDIGQSLGQLTEAQRNMAEVQLETNRLIGSSLGLLNQIKGRLE